MIRAADVGEQEGTSFLVMEYLEGDTLSDRLRKGPMPWEQVLRVGAEICEGLEKAHRNGIVHRDLKPSNVMLTKSGAKLMDFGLAKPNDSTSGSEPDPISAVQPMTPLALEQVVRTCLAKEPEERFQSAHDLKLQLQWIASSGTQVGIPAIAASRRSEPGKVLAATLATGWILAVGSAILAAIYAGGLNSARQLVRAVIGLPSGFDFADTSQGAPVLSPDAQRLAFVAVTRGTTQGDSPSRTMILVRQMSTGDAVPLAGTDEASFPFWSPDGKYLGLFADGKLKKVDASGGPPQILCDAPDGRGGTWSR
jgi:Protein kinase domain/WD40-like Beta Propeller Repeat